MKAKVNIEKLGFDKYFESLEDDGYMIGTKRFFGENRDQLAKEWINKTVRKVDAIATELKHLPYLSVTQASITFKLND